MRSDLRLTAVVFCSLLIGYYYISKGQVQRDGYKDTDYLKNVPARNNLSRLINITYLLNVNRPITHTVNSPIAYLNFRKGQMQSDTDNWTQGLDFPFQYESFYKTINEFVEKQGRFPWHLVDNNTLFNGINILEYVEKFAVKGDPFHPLDALYRNPCWMQSDTPLHASRTGRPSSGNMSLACLPYFYLAGFPKCGTTDVYVKLTKNHPAIIITAIKELHYWTKSRGDFRKYLRRFGSEAFAKIYSSRDKRGSSTINPLLLVDGEPSTIWRSGSGGKDLRYIAPLALRAIQPNAKFVVLVRNPTERTISHYKHFQPSKSPKAMYEYMTDVVPTLKKCIHENGIRFCAYVPGSFGVGPSDEFRASLYYVFLRDWLAIYPKKQLLLIKSEEYFQKPLVVFDQICQFLGITNMSSLAELQGFEEVNNQRLWSQEVLDKEKIYINKTEALLDELYSPINKKLADLIGNDRFLWYTT